MQDDLGVRFGKPKTYRGFVSPEPPKTENFGVIHGCRFRILYPNHHAVYLSQHTSNLSNPLRSCRGGSDPPLFPTHLLGRWVDRARKGPEWDVPALYWLQLCAGW